MKTILISFGLICSLQLFANPYSADSATNIIQSLETDVAGKGKVRIHQDARIDNLLGKPKTTTSTRSNFTVGKGFRIQIYSGNNQNTSKKEAYDRDATIKRDMPDVETFISFKSPFWRLRIGNCRSYEEAHEILRKVKELFPQFGKESYIVKDDIKIYR